MSNVLAVLEHRDGAIRKVSHEVVTGARRLADALGGGASVDALVLAAGPARGSDQLGGFGADRVITLTNAAFGSYAPEGYTRAIADRLKTGAYGALVFAASAAGKDLAPQLGPVDDAARRDVARERVLGDERVVKLRQERPRWPHHVLGDPGREGQAPRVEIGEAEQRVDYDEGVVLSG